MVALPLGVGLSKARIDLVDALRGFALLGLLLVHCYERFEIYWLDPQPDIWVDVIASVFGGKSFAIFALLFGFSLATIMENERKRGNDFTRRFVWRLLLLFGFGLLHQIFYSGDIMQVLALVGLIVLPFEKIRSNRVLLFIAVLAFLQLPLWFRAIAANLGADWALSLPTFMSEGSRSVLVTGSFQEVAVANFSSGMAMKWSYYWVAGRISEIFGLFLVGIVIQRQGLFLRAQDKMGLWLKVLCLSAVCWSLLTIIQPMITLPWPSDGSSPMEAMSITFALQQWTAVAAVAFQVAAFVILWSKGADKALRLLAWPGRLTLTFYIGQSVVMTALLYGYGFALHDDLSTDQVAALGLAFFALQIAIAKLWLKYFFQGPLEWLWRALTRTSFDAALRRPAAAKA